MSDVRVCVGRTKLSNNAYKDKVSWHLISLQFADTVWYTEGVPLCSGRRFFNKRVISNLYLSDNGEKFWKISTRLCLKNIQLNKMYVPVMLVKMLPNFEHWAFRWAHLIFYWRVLFWVQYSIVQTSVTANVTFLLHYNPKLLCIYMWHRHKTNVVR